MTVMMMAVRGLTFDCLLHRVANKGSEIICCDGSVCLGHEAVRSLSSAVYEEAKWLMSRGYIVHMLKLGSCALV